ncbi:partial adenylylsulfate kinase, partial [Methylophilaceae bacterium]
MGSGFTQVTVLDAQKIERADDMYDKSHQVISTNITWVEGKVSAENRAKLLRQDAATIWLTGLSGSGKSTIAVELEKHLFSNGHAVYALDGDNIR